MGGNTNRCMKNGSGKDAGIGKCFKCNNYGSLFIVTGGRLVVTFLSMHLLIPYEAYIEILFVYKDPPFCTQRYFLVPTRSFPFSPSNLIIPPSSPLFSPSFF